MYLRMMKAQIFDNGIGNEAEIFPCAVIFNQKRRILKNIGILEQLDYVYFDLVTESFSHFKLRYSIFKIQEIPLQNHRKLMSDKYKPVGGMSSFCLVFWGKIIRVLITFTKKMYKIK